MIDELRAAVDALNSGDPAPLASLIATGSEWRGVREGHLWWKSRPSCRGPFEAFEVMNNGVRNRGGRPAATDPQFEQIDENTIIASGLIVENDGRERLRYMVFSVKDDKIVGMQGCRSHREAARAVQSASH